MSEYDSITPWAVLATALLVVFGLREPDATPRSPGNITAPQRTTRM